MKSASGRAASSLYCVGSLLPIGASALSLAVDAGHLLCVETLRDRVGEQDAVAGRFQGGKSLLALALKAAQGEGEPGGALACLEFLCARWPRPAAIAATGIFGWDLLPAFCAKLEAEGLAEAAGIQPRPAGLPAAQSLALGVFGPAANTPAPRRI